MIGPLFALLFIGVLLFIILGYKRQFRKSKNLINKIETKKGYLRRISCKARIYNKEPLSEITYQKLQSGLLYVFADHLILTNSSDPDWQNVLFYKGIKKKYQDSTITAKITDSKLIGNCLTLTVDELETNLHNFSLETMRYEIVLDGIDDSIISDLALAI